MSYEKKSFKAADAVEIVYHKWIPDTNIIRASIVIAHGMAEHGLRYDDFANHLNANGFIVYVPDHRGHGATAGSPENTGFFAEYNGWCKVTDDIRTMIEYARTENPDKQVYLLGHSMGSFIARTYICLHGNQIDGVILSGTGQNPGLIVKAGSILASIISGIKGKKHRSRFLDNLSFGAFNKGFSSPFQWLSRDNEIVERYVSDPYCGQVFTAGFFHDLFSGLMFIGNKSKLEKMPKQLPVFIISGDNDPVGANGKGVSKVHQMFLDVGMIDVRFTLYEGARHEVLNETNRSEVYDDIVKWLRRKILYHGK